MNLFKDIKRDYGQEAVKQLRLYERNERKLARYRNHRVFTLRCRDLDLTPPSVKPTCPINTNRAREIVKKAQKDFLRERLRVINHRIDDFKSKSESYNLKIQDRFPGDVQRHVDDHIARSREGEFSRSKLRQTRKLDRLQEKQIIQRPGSGILQHVRSLDNFEVDIDRRVYTINTFRSEVRWHTNGR